MAFDPQTLLKIWEMGKHSRQNIYIKIVSRKIRVSDFVIQYF